jgi:membrane-associated phospholipid phosphatase
VKILFIFFFFVTTDCIGQQDTLKTYSWNAPVDIGALGMGVAMNAYFLLEEPNQERYVTLDEILSVSRMEISSWERSATYNWNESAEHLSDYIQGISLLSPLALMVSAEMRADAIIIGTMAAESMLLTQGISGILKIHTDRKRPFLYNEEAPVEFKYRRQVFYSFPSAHTSASAAGTFYSARVFSHYFPDSKWKKWVWSGAVLLPAITGYLRYEAGRHFITDVAAGYAIGATIGYLIPELHFNHQGEKVYLRINSVQGGMGLSMSIILD